MELVPELVLEKESKVSPNSHLIPKGISKASKGCDKARVVSGDASEMAVETDDRYPRRWGDAKLVDGESGS